MAGWIAVSGYGNSMRMRFAMLGALLAVNALAQEETSPPPLVTETPAQEQPWVPSYQRPDFAYAETSTLEDPGGRVRWGLSFNLGWHLPYHAFGLGLDLHVGHQFSRNFALYAFTQGQLGFGLGVETGEGGASVSARFLAHLVGGAIAEVTLGDHFYLGAGPAVGYGVFGMAGINVADAQGTITGVGQYGFKPGIDLRAGFGFGKARAPRFRRGGFNLGVDVLILFHPDTIFTRVRAGSTGGSVEVRENGWMTTVTPMLTLGYDSR